VPDAADMLVGPVGDNDEDGPEHAATKASAAATEKAVSNCRVGCNFIRTLLVGPEIVRGPSAEEQECRQSSFS
jgi:hypothetical protein